ncbi:MAG TPA: hypothetical protein VF462_08490, partial [Micromonosporaceae bacterium]
MSEQPGSDRPADQPAAAEPASPDGPSAADPSDEARAEETTAQAPPRWKGSAAVPSRAPRKRRWLETAVDAAPPGRQPDPTRELPPDERDLPELATPVDPWAGADL